MTIGTKRAVTLLSEYKPTPYRIEEIYLTVAIDATCTRVSSRLRIAHNPASSEQDAPLLLDGEDIELVSVHLDGRLLTEGEYEYSGSLLSIQTLPKTPFVLEIVNHCNPSANTALSGFYRSNEIYCSQCEAEGFRRIAFAYDRPDAMAIYHVRIEADRHECPVLLSNGNLLETGMIDQSNRHYAIWHDPHPKPTYLFALVAGDLACVKSTFTTCSGREVQLGIYVEHGKEDRCDFAMQALKDSMAWDERRFAREYDLDIFNIVAISDFNMGAMENKGLNIFSDKYILALPETATDQDYVNIESIIAHEYFHNWTGNRITCRDWFQLCLKEGLTVFRDQEFTADMRSRAVARIADVQTLRARQMPEDAGPLAHPPRPSSYIEINNFYTPTVYEKGAEICRMLHTLLGEPVFRQGMDHYFNSHDGEAATVEQFIGCFAKVSGRDLSQFFNWYEQAGTPKLDVRTRYDAKEGAFTLTLTQHTPATPGQADKRPQHIPLALGLLDTHGRDLPLHLEGTGALNHPILELRDESRSYRFTGLKERPVLSLNRSFSAPVIIETDQSSEDRLFLMAHDSDSFNRWESGQTEATRLFAATVRAMANGSAYPDTAPLAAAIGKCLADTSLEQAFRAQMVSLPSEEMICAAIASDIDTDIVHAARRHVRAAIARQLLPLLTETYHSTIEHEAYQPSAKAAGRRLLHFAALALITAADPQTGQMMIMQELEKAESMTAKMGALTSALQLAPDAAEQAFDRFYTEHRSDHLLVNKWFGLMASIPGADASQRIARLLGHADFKWTTPNRVYAVIGSFTSGNLSGFNAADGSGYKIVAGAILRLDPLNPQVAARMATSFRSWKLMNMPRRQAAQAAMQQIVAQPNLSADSFEIISKMLA